MHYAGALSCIDRAYALGIRIPSGFVKQGTLPISAGKVATGADCHRRVANECKALCNIRYIHKSRIRGTLCIILVPLSYYAYSVHYMDTCTVNRDH